MAQPDYKKEFAEKVEQAKKIGITDGSRLSDPITREEAIVMLSLIHI